MKYFAIIVAGGSGNRMQSHIPKQFLILEGKPVLMHTIAAFESSTYQPEIILVLNIHQHSNWEELCQKYNFDIPHRVVNGGEQRFHSVKNGLKAIKENGIVAVHDAARPLVSAILIDKSFQTAAANGNCVAGIKPTDSVRKIMESDNEALDRNVLALIQTPQTFQVAMLKKAYEAAFRNEFTDDASVVEYAGIKINLIVGERENIKITYPEDLEIAAIFMKNR